MYLRGCIESLSLELAVYGSKNEYTRTDTVLTQIYEVSTGVVYLVFFFFWGGRYGERGWVEGVCGKGEGWVGLVVLLVRQLSIYFYTSKVNKKDHQREMSDHIY